jgi:hypothetical protein
MTNFVVVKEFFSGDQDNFYLNFEKKVEMHINNGWKVINCTITKGAAYAFMQKD